MNNEVQIRVDEENDVLYAKRKGTSSRNSNEAPHDGGLILSYDSRGDVVGITLLAAHEMPSDLWLRHSDREALPSDILSALDTWMGSRNRHS